MRAHLTEVTVRSLKTTTKQEKVWDISTPGFGVRVNGTTKSWVVMYGERRQLKTIGRYPSMTLADARKKARKLLAADPEEVTANVSVEDAFGEYERSHGAEHHGARTRHETRRLYERYVQAAVGHRKLSTLNFGLVEGLLQSKPAEANHLFRSLRAFLNWCVRKEYLLVNPLAGKQQPAKERARDRVLSNEEIARLWNTAEGQYGIIWKLLLFTGQRRAQIVGLEWEWVKDDRIEFPATIMKSAKPHIIPIGKMSRQFLPRREGRYVFPSSKGGHIENLHIHKNPHDTRAAVDAYTIHDLRRAFAALHAQCGTPIHLVEKMLAHTSGTFAGIVGVYHRYSYEQEMREAVQKYEEYIQSIVAPAA